MNTSRKLFLKGVLAEAKENIFSANIIEYPDSLMQPCLNNNTDIHALEEHDGKKWTQASPSFIT